MVDFKQIPSSVNEDYYKSDIQSPTELAIKLAKVKAESIATKYPGSIVIGSDQVASLENLILGKGLDPEVCKDHLKSLSGKTHLLTTAVCVIKRAEVFEFHNITKLTMRDLNADEIERYVIKDNPIDCAGSYKIEESGISLFNKIETSDFTAIEGLPLLELNRILKSLQ